MIVVGGCSFTDSNWPKKAKPNPKDFKMWPELLADKLDTKVINTAKSGCGNERIYNTVVDAIMKYNPDRVIVAWTEWTRMDFMVSKPTEYHTVVPRLQDETDIYGRRVYDYNYLNEWYESRFGDRYPDIKDVVSKNLRYFYSLYCIAIERNIELNMFQMLPPISRIMKDNDSHEGMMRQVKQEIIGNPVSLLLDNCFWNFPPLRDFGGYYIGELLEKQGRFTRVSGVDNHPDEDTQKNIMELIYDEITT